MTDITESNPADHNPQIQGFVDAALQQLRQLTLQRHEITRRIATIKRTIGGLTALYGVDLAGEEQGRFMERKHTVRKRGLTDSCRAILKQSDRLLTADDVCVLLDQTYPDLLLHNRDRHASVVTILNRLVRYGEAGTSFYNGRRVWQKKA